MATKDELDWMALARQLRKESGAKQVAVAIECTSVSGPAFRQFLRVSRENGLTPEAWPLERGEAAAVTLVKGKSSVRITVTTEVDHAGA